MFEFSSLNPTHLPDRADAARLWTRACGDAFALSQRALAYTTRPCLGARQAGQFAQGDGERVGFVLAGALQKDARAVCSHWKIHCVPSNVFIRRRCRVRGAK